MVVMIMMMLLLLTDDGRGNGKMSNDKDDNVVHQTSTIWMY
jgi:hypothetical protein